MKCVASICDPPLSSFLLSSCFFFHFIPSLAFSPLCPVSASVPCKERCICFCINRAIGPRIFDFALAPSALSASLFGTCCHGSAGECRCCCALIRQGQSNPDDRKVGKCVEIFFYSVDQVFAFQYAYWGFSQKANYFSYCRIRATEGQKKYARKESKIIRNTKMSAAFLAMKEVRLSLRQS